MEKERLGIFAGRGELPWIAARNAQREGEDIRIFCIEAIDVPEEFSSLSEEVVLTKFYSSVIPALKRWEIKRVMAIGKITRETIYKKGYGYDLRLMLRFFQARSQSDHNLFLIGEDILKKSGVEILPQALFFKGSFSRRGTLWKQN